MSRRPLWIQQFAQQRSEGFVRAGLLVGLAVASGVVVAIGLLPIAAVFGLGVKTAAAGFESAPSGLLTPTLPQQSTMLAADGTKIATVYLRNRIAVPLKDISVTMRHAIIATEDARFYEHPGVDIRGTARAMFSNLLGGRVQGGSTLSQQYVKNVLIETATSADEIQQARAKRLSRKVRELRLALSLERRMTKDQILENYLNIAFFGSHAYGIETASRRYFSKPASKLTLAEAATLAGIVQSPTLYNPVLNPEQSLHRRQVVLSRMLAQGYITREQAQAAARIPTKKLLNVTPFENGCPISKTPFFCDYVLQSLRTDPVFGPDAATREQLLRNGGLVIRTTLDLKAQEAADRTVRKYIPAKDPSRKAAALSMVRPGTGEIMAMAQNRAWGTNGLGKTAVNYNVGRTHNGIVGLQAGSTFKAFVLAAAMHQRMNPYQGISAPAVNTFSGFVNCDTSVHFPAYTVHNSSASENGTFTMFTGAGASVNTFFMALEQKAGLCQSAEMATALGIKGGDERPVEVVPSFTLGTSLVTPLAMANAYATFAAHGVYCVPRAVVEVSTENGTSLVRPAPQCEQVLDRPTADGVTKILRGIISGPFPRTGAALSIGRDAAGKTGTIDGNASVWFVGFTPDAAAAVWCGDPRGGQKHPMRNITINGKHYGEVFGATIPGPIWRDTMKAALAHIAPTPFDLQTFTGDWTKPGTVLWPADLPPPSIINSIYEMSPRPENSLGPNGPAVTPTASPSASDTASQVPSQAPSP
ncbi:MAG: penicillin-binding protein [Actinobacteria bacterium]|nr:penicillin-binding protein [Actinomycetota bacterium]